MNGETTKTEDGLNVWCRYHELADPTALTPHPQNSRRHPPQQIKLLAALIHGIGWHDTVTVSRLSGRITKGHARREAAMLLKARQVPVEYQDYADEIAELADLTADNRIKEFSYYDAGKLREAIRKLEAAGGSAAMTGYDDTLIKALLSTQDTALMLPVAQHAAPDTGEGIRQVILIYTPEEFIRFAQAVRNVMMKRGATSPSEAVMMAVRNETRDLEPAAG